MDAAISDLYPLAQCRTYSLFVSISAKFVFIKSNGKFSTSTTCSDKYSESFRTSNKTSPVLLFNLFVNSVAEIEPILSYSIRLDI